MDPLQSTIFGQPILASQSANYLFLIPGIFDSVEEQNKLLSSYDSDTRDYVMKHAGEFNSKSDIVDCVNKLRNQS